MSVVESQRRDIAAMRAQAARVRALGREREADKLEAAAGKWEARLDAAEESSEGE